MTSKHSGRERRGEERHKVAKLLRESHADVLSIRSIQITCQRIIVASNLFSFGFEDL